LLAAAAAAAAAAGAGALKPLLAALHPAGTDRPVSMIPPNSLAAFNGAGSVGLGLVAPLGASSGAWVAFHQRSAPTSRRGLAARGRGRSVYALMMAGTVDDETQKLLDAAKKMREEAAEMEEALGRTVPTKPVAVKEKAEDKPAAIPLVPMTEADLLNKLSTLPYDSAETACSTLDGLRKEGVLGLWGSANLGETFAVSQAQLKSQTGIDGQALNAEQNLDDLKVLLGISVAGSFVLGVAANLGLGALGYPNAGATVSYLIALIPILILSIGSTSPGLIIAALSIFKTRSDSDFSSRRVQHEAAHMLAGYLCGLPIKSYAIKGPTSEVEFYDTVSGDFDDLGRRLTSAEIKPLSVVALAGAVGEVKKFGKATGSAQDLDSLGRLMNRVDPYVSNPVTHAHAGVSSTSLVLMLFDFLVQMNGAAQEAQTRWAAMMAYRLLGRYEKEYKALADAFEAKKSVPECIAALEMAARQNTSSK
jgi:hypothetical protein